MNKNHSSRAFYLPDMCVRRGVAHTPAWADEVLFFSAMWLVAAMCAFSFDRRSLRKYRWRIEATLISTPKYEP